MEWHEHISFNHPTLIEIIEIKKDAAITEIPISHFPNIIIIILILILILILFILFNITIHTLDRTIQLTSSSQPWK